MRFRRLSLALSLLSPPKLASKLQWPVHLVHLLLCWLILRRELSPYLQDVSYLGARPLLYLYE